MTLTIHVRHHVSTDPVPQVALLSAGCWLARLVEGKALRARVVAWWRRERFVNRESLFVEFEAMEVLSE